MGKQTPLAPPSLFYSPSTALLATDQRLYKLHRQPQQRKRRGRGQPLPISKPRQPINGRFEGVQHGTL